MDKIKIFRNMTGVEAASKLKGTISDKHWWFGVAGNILSTVMGIALTLGIAGLVDHHKDKRLAREMMFYVVKTAEDKIPDLENADSLVTEESTAVVSLLMYNFKYKGDLSQVPEDTLMKKLRKCYCYSYLSNYYSKTDSYFYSAQMMHQFNNPEVYAYFSAYVEYDKETSELLSSLHDKAVALREIIQSRNFSEEVTTAELIKGLIDDKTLPDYMAYLFSSGLKTKISGYKQFFDNLLLEMGATKEEYEKYKADNPIIDAEKVTNLSD